MAEEHTGAMPVRADRVALIGLRRPGEHPWAIDAAFDGIERWLRAAGRSVVYRAWQRRRAPDAATYIGRGKAEQLRDLCERGGVDGVLVDGTLSRAQREGLERLLNRPVWDRTAWGEGPGPSTAVASARTLARAARRRRGAVNVVLCGGAGVGKSTLFAALTNGPVLPPSWPAGPRAGGPAVLTRRLRHAPRDREITVTDTPGLIRDPDTGAWIVPDATIAEARAADLVVYLIDASHPEAGRRAREVAAALDDAGAGPMIPVWTQVDRLAAGTRVRAVWAVSGRTGSGCDRLGRHLRRVTRPAARPRESSGRAALCYSVPRCARPE
jgi:50S ribosomal subunit-associated GTPase HflX